MNDFKKSATGKIQLTITINFISSKETDKECVMHSKNDNIEIMINLQMNFFNNFFLDTKLG